MVFRTAYRNAKEIPSKGGKAKEVFKKGKKGTQKPGEMQIESIDGSGYRGDCKKKLVGFYRMRPPDRKQRGSHAKAQTHMPRTILSRVL